jgi:hypothetical protein
MYHIALSLLPRYAAVNRKLQYLDISVYTVHKDEHMAHKISADMSKA